MRLATLVALAVLLAGCGEPKDGTPAGPDDPNAVAPQDAPASFDDLTEHLDPASHAFQDFLVEEDNASLPGGASIAFQTGRGMHCAGDADPVAPNQTGWVACLVRIAAKPTWVAQDVHELGIGYDVQRLSLRLAAEPVEWRAVVSILVEGRVETLHDTGWRAVDLTPTVGEPTLQVLIDSPCDNPASSEDNPTTATRERSGAATLYVNFTAAHGAPFVGVDLLRSLPVEATSVPFAGHATGEHGLVATYAPFGGGAAGTLELAVDLEAPDDVKEATPGPPCTLVVGRETQAWTVLVGVVGADGRTQYLTRTVDVEVLQDAA